jgi:hypothetical protein
MFISNQHNTEYQVKCANYSVLNILECTRLLNSNIQVVYKIMVPLCAASQGGDLTISKPF